LLSGGIGPEYICDLQAFRHPLMVGVDLNSRFEVAPALKDAGMIERFIKELKNNIKNESNNKSF
jgi:phosphoribosylanthranilate isomerase